ncbi:hypothetical protein M9H77_28717 [Catharanthus roseus]|uniref:Uncharacterized protein n=1 Tax=Catharanthus roseus TaxID=4058 RepID=A0ACC0AIC8_CATRO|nr:hypothetical protein M9H77_28717 [Catharanthus roseus]
MGCCLSCISIPEYSVDIFVFPMFAPPLDMMTADEVRWMLYRTQDVRDCWCIPAHHIQPREARRLPNNRMYVLRNTFVEALWLEVPSYLLTETWTSVPAIPASSCTDDYLD